MKNIPTSRGFKHFSPWTVWAFPLLALSTIGNGCGNSPDESVDTQPCNSDKHCVRESGESFCEDNFTWQDPNDLENYNCIPKTQLLGGFSHDLTQVDLTVITDGTEGLSQPRDIALDPHTPNELWVVNAGDNSVTILVDPATDAQHSGKFNSFGSDHFLAHPSALAFSPTGMWASAQEEDQETQGPVAQGGTPADFMGPTLWPDDLSFFDAGHASHMDMLHNSPNSTGIAWEAGNVYWVHDGLHGCISRYDFAADHGPGGRDHSDGSMARYVAGEVSYVPEVGSNMEIDHATNLLYISDTGANRVAVLDTQSGTRGSQIFPNYDGGPQYSMNGADFSTLIDGNTVDGMEMPSGLELHDGLLYISDNQSSMIFAFALDGTLVDYLDTGLPAGSIQGMAFGPNGALFFVDTASNSVWRLAAK